MKYSIESKILAYLQIDSNSNSLAIFFLYSNPVSVYSYHILKILPNNLIITTPSILPKNEFNQAHFPHPHPPHPPNLHLSISSSSLILKTFLTSSNHNPNFLHSLKTNFLIILFLSQYLKPIKTQPIQFHIPQPTQPNPKIPSNLSKLQITIIHAKRFIRRKNNPSRRSEPRQPHLQAILQQSFKRRIQPNKPAKINPALRAGTVHIYVHIK